jgi:BolA protein
METIRARIESILREAFDPERLEIEDDTHRHAGHRGAASGGGHYRVVVVAEAFRGLTRLEQHRRVYDALGELIGRDVHALGLRTAAPDRRGGGEMGA